MSQVVPKGEILAHLEKAKGKAQPLGTDGPAPATRYRLADGTTFGIVASTTEPFCMRCDRARVTADGIYFPCLYAEKGIDLRTRVRANASDDELAQVLEEAWRARNDRGAEVRAALKTRDVLIPASRLRENTHWEMHTRGG
jgi:cyclic pyranopterin phosphate synthase